MLVQSSPGGGGGYIYTYTTTSQYPSGCLLASKYYLASASTTAKNRSGNGLIYIRSNNN